MAEVTVTDIVKNFGKVEVLKKVSVAIADGELLVVLGPSGCGKSTLLRIIAGLERASSGDVHIGERRVNDLEPAERDIAMVFQNYALYPHMSVRQNMAYGLKNLGTPRDVIERRVGDAAAILGLAELLDRKPRQLSGGQRQRVAMGRAIVREPAVYLFDEPLSNLDAKLRVQMLHEISQLQTRLRTTGVFVTHDQVEAMTLGDRLMVMNDGITEQIGPPLEIYERPASTFVAGFIGSPAMNFVTGRVDDDGRAVVLAGARIALPRPLDGDAGREVTVGIRPEHLQPGEDGDLELAVGWVEALGADTVVHGRLGPEAAPLTARCPGGMRITAGDRLRFAIPPDALHLFEPGSGRRRASA
jgi:sn-glycerol 3-phosphate transport system ATP-binding protein